MSERERERRGGMFLEVGERRKKSRRNGRQKGGALWQLSRVLCPPGFPNPKAGPGSVICLAN